MSQLFVELHDCVTIHNEEKCGNVCVCHYRGTIIMLVCGFFMKYALTKLMNIFNGLHYMPAIVLIVCDFAVVI